MEDTVEHCAKISLEDGRDLYFSIKEEIEEAKDKSLWSIILTDGYKVWDTKVSEDNLKDMAVGSSYTTEQFINLFKTAFNLRQSEPDTILKYTLTALSAGRDCFFWSIFLPKDNKTFRLGSLDVSPLSEEARGPVYCRMFDSLLSVSTQSMSQAERCKAESEEQKAVTKLALQKLEKFAVVQETSERVLYTNFVAVLNEKKRKIRELQDQCDTLTQSLGATNSNSVQGTVPDPPSKTTSKRGRGRQAKAPAARVTACTAPTARLRNRGKAALSYDSGDTTEEDVEQTTSKQSKKVIESSDDEATDVDEPERVTRPLSTLSHDSSQTASQAATQVVELDLDASESVTSIKRKSTFELKHTAMDVDPEVLPEDKSRTDVSAADVVPVKERPVVTTPSKRLAGDELDDLLGESKPAMATRNKSPVKRKAGAKAVPAAAPPRLARRSRAKESASKADLIDDLLDGM